MRSDRCKCGNATRFGSGLTYHPCEGCEECQTTFASHPDDHKTLQPHAFRPVYDRYTREPVDEECTRCLASKNRLAEIRAGREALRKDEALQAERHKSELADGTAEYRALVEESARQIGTVPHCDSLVLHAPGECEFCDGRPELQKWRADHNVNFTGHSDSDKAQCFAARRRSVENINHWSGNVASPAVP